MASDHNLRIAVYAEVKTQSFFLQTTKTEYAENWQVKTDLVNIYAYAKLGRIPSICSKDIEWKWNFDNNQGP